MTMIVFVVAGTPVVVVTYVGFATTTGLVVVVVVIVVAAGTDTVVVRGGGAETRCESGSEAQPARRTRAPQSTEAGAKR